MSSNIFTDFYMGVICSRLNGNLYTPYTRSLSCSSFAGDNALWISPNVHRCTIIGDVSENRQNSVKLEVFFLRKKFACRFVECDRLREKLIGSCFVRKVAMKNNVTYSNSLFHRWEYCCVRVYKGVLGISSLICGLWALWCSFHEKVTTPDGIQQFCESVLNNSRIKIINKNFFAHN